MTYTYKPCLLCIGVASLWLLLSLGIVLGALAGSPSLHLVIALLMGTSVMGIAGLGEKRVLWANRHPQQWKLIVLLIGVPAAYLALTNLSLAVIVAEVIVLVIIGHILFRRSDLVSLPPASEATKKDPRYQALMKELENCCN